MFNDDEIIIDGICEYAKEKMVKELLQEYLKRIIVQKPADPLAFLLENIRDKPFNPKSD